MHMRSRSGFNIRSPAGVQRGKTPLTGARGGPPAFSSSPSPLRSLRREMGTQVLRVFEMASRQRSHYGCLSSSFQRNLM